MQSIISSLKKQKIQNVLLITLVVVLVVGYVGYEAFKWKVSYDYVGYFQGKTIDEKLTYCQDRVLADQCLLLAVMGEKDKAAIPENACDPLPKKIKRMACIAGMERCYLVTEKELRMACETLVKHNRENP